LNINKSTSFGNDDKPIVSKGSYQIPNEYGDLDEENEEVFDYDLSEKQEAK
jgi:hypothetical protein